jgi:type I restriction enzyme S subunit
MSEEATLDKFVGDETAKDGEDEGGDEPSEHPQFGTVPSEWGIREISEIAEVVGGSTPSTSNETYWGGGIPWATPTDITELSGNRIEETASTITEEGLDSASTHLLPPYSVLMTSRATIGECAVNTTEMATNQGFKSLIPKEDIETWYLYYRMVGTAPFLESLGAGSTFDEVSKSVVQTVDVPVPPVEEQQKIASVLYTVDQAILKTQEIVNQADKVKKGLIQKFYSEGYYDHEEWQEVDKQDAYVMTRADKIPAEWDIRQSGEIADVKTGHTPSTSVDEYWDGDILWVDIHDLTQLEKTVIETTDDTITEEGLENSGAKLLPEGTLVLCRTGAIGETAILGKEMATDQDQVTFECDESIVLPRYLMYLFEFATPQLERLSAGSTHDKVQLHFFSDLEIPLPSLDEQQEIVDALESVDDVVIANKKQLGSLERLKTGLRQDLLSGDVRTAGKNIDIPDEVENYEPE